VELHEWDFSSSIIQAIKLRRVRYAWHVVRVEGAKKCMQGFGVETYKKQITWKVYAYIGG